MEANYDDIIQLERYLEKSLSEAEALKVEQRLAVEPGFRELYQNEKLLIDGIRYGHLKSRLDELKRLEGVLPPVESVSKEGILIRMGSYWKPLSVAASIFMVVVFYFLSKPSDPQQLFAEYYTHYPNIFKGAKRNLDASNPQDQAYKAYDRLDFENAAKEFGEMWKNKEALDPKDRPEVLLLLGNSNLMLGRTEEARDNFITLSKDFDELDDQARWFLSLCYLKLGNKEAARVLFEEIAGGTSSYKEKARELLNNLK